MRTNPSKLSFSSLYNAFKNFDFAEGTATVSGTISSGGEAFYTTTVSLDRENSTTQIYFSTDVTSTFHSPGNTYLLINNTIINHTNGSTPTFPGTAAYSIFFQTLYSSPDVTLKLYIPNPYSEVLTPVGENIDFLLYSFIAPFQT